MCAGIISDAVFGDVPSVFTRPVAEVRQAKQDGGGNIYMAHIYALVFPQNVLQNLPNSCPFSF